MLNIFDVDNTILKKSSSFYFILEAIAEKAISISQVRALPFEWLRYKMGVPNVDFIEEAVKHIAGIKKETVENIAEASFTRRMKPGIYQNAGELIAQMQKRGEKIILATSSFSCIIQPLQRFLGISEIIASSLEFSPEGIATGRISGAGVFGENKKTAVQAWLAEHHVDPADACFYTDSYTDIPLMKYCGKAVAVNPDRFLERKAKKQGWEILRFRWTLGAGVAGKSFGNI